MNLLIILISSFCVGMIVGIIIKQKNYYHGPNARKVCSKVYWSKKNKKCIKFGIQLV